MFMTQKDQRERAPSWRGANGLNSAIPALALIYALLAGLRTAGDPDLGWQLATGRWIVQHRAIPHTDILSFTARGQEWIYPVLSQIILYGTFQLGGYSLISWLGAAACVGTIAILLRGRMATQLLAVLSVPLIASRTAPRAELFTTVLFAAFVSVLWNYHRSGRGPLWMLPPLMFLWVNLHLGFVSGLGMCAAYIFLELGETLVTDLRPDALKRLRHATPWLIVTIVATSLNPWGTSNYIGMVRLVPVHSSNWIVELMNVPVTMTKMAEALAWRDPKSALWWMILAATVALLVSAYQRRVAPSILLGVSLYLVVHAVRFVGPFATVVVVIGGSILTDGFEITHVRRALRWMSHGEGDFRRMSATWAFVISLACFVGVRGWDLVTNRFYLRTPLQSSFGPGESWWYPEEAAAFLKREHLPGNVFNDYTSGGFVAWRLSPEYPDYIDGRGGPFGGRLFFRSLELSSKSLDSPEWQEETNSRGINTVFVSMDRDIGLGLYKINQYCRSSTWRPVYLDPKAAIFVRVRPETEELIRRLQIDCDKVSFNEPPLRESYRFNHYLTSSAILAVLGRDSEALHQLNLAEKISSENGYAHYVRGMLLLRAEETKEAETELQKSLQLEPSDLTSLALVALYKKAGRYAEAADVLSHQAALAPQPGPLYLELGSVQLEMHQPNDAVVSFNRAERESPFMGEAAVLGVSFNSRLAAERARAYRSLGDLAQAISFQERSVQFTPKERNGWLELAGLYESAGQTAKSLEARRAAADIGEEQGAVETAERH